MAVVKIIELVGSSRVSTDDAAQQALKQAQDSLSQHPRRGHRLDRHPRENLDEYRAHVRVAFLIEGKDVTLGEQESGGVRPALQLTPAPPTRSN